MDKKQNIGIALMVILVLGFIWLTKPSEEEIRQQKLAEEAKAVAAPPSQATPPDSSKVASNADATPPQLDIPDSVPLNTGDYGFFSPAKEGDDSISFLENDLLRLQFSSRGGKLNAVLLKKYKTYDKKPLFLIDNSNIKQSLALTIKNQVNKIDLYNLYFKEVKVSTGEQGENILEFTASLEGGKTIKQTYSLAPHSYTISYKLDMSDIAPNIDNEKHLTWKMQYKRIEEHIDGILGARNKSSIDFYTEKEYDTTGASTDKTVDKEIKTPLRWFSFKQKYFNSALINTDGEFRSAKFVTDPKMDQDTTYIKTVYADIVLDGNKNDTGKYELLYYFGPNDHKILSKLDPVAPDFSKNVYLGWALFAWVNMWLIIPLFTALESVFSSYGIIILMIVFIVKLVLSPLSYKSYKSMAKMRVLKPELNEIKEKYPKDKQKQQQEQMKLYSQFGISPLSGCIPMIMQMPILLAMFYFFPNAVALRQESFLWAHDLSTYDDVIRLGFEIPFLGSHLSLFTLLMTLSSLLYTWMNNQMSNVEGPMKNIGYIAPVVFFFVLNSYPAGLTFYYFVSNIVTFSQQAIIKKTINEEKIRAKLEENKLKNKDKKKSGWRARLDEAMKAQQETAKNKTNKKNKK